ncbi:MAG: hypothetical protein HY228_02515 [Candidatus Yonathbacteria bacterium]|nr:hypothetical protein [Candidatus Yonathbacteria bacterium]
MIRPILYIIVIIISLGFTLLNVRPAYYRMEAKRAFLGTLNEASNGTDKIKALIGQTELELSKIDPVNLEKFNVFLPETIDDVRFVNNISHIGALNSIVLEGISVEKTENGQPSSKTESPEGRLITLPSFLQGSSATPSGVSSEKRYVTTKAKFSFNASYEKALIFFNDLEKSLGLINITALSFSPQEQKSDSKKGVGGPISYRYTMEIETYSLRGPSGEIISSTK